MSKTAKIINTIFFIIVVLVGVFLYAKYQGVKGLVVKEYRVDSTILTNNFSGIKIIHISDILYGSTVDNKDLEILVDKVNTLKPDIIVFTGDLILKGVKIKEEDKNFIISCLKNMKASLGKYAIKGDNDYHVDDYEYILNNSEFDLLSNSYEEIYYKDQNNIYIVGLPSLEETTNLEESFKFYTDENRKYTIVLVHEGNTINKLNSSPYEVDLILGGHSLNGSVILPYYGSLFIPKESQSYYAPYYKKGITNIYISSGLGTYNYAYRFLNKPSFNLYRLNSI